MFGLRLRRKQLLLTQANSMKEEIETKAELTLYIQVDVRERTALAKNHCLLCLHVDRC